MDKKIIWEKYVDPLNSNADEADWSEFDLDEDIETSFAAKPIKVIQTPLGFIPTLDTSFASSNFDFWMMHTNFDITSEIVDIITTTDGVETFEIYTRYRARIGFPRSGFFRPREVMSEIQNHIKEFNVNKQLLILSNFPEEVQDKVKNTIEQINQKSKHWIIFVLPNGNLDLITSDIDDNLYRKKVKNLIKIHKDIGGKIIRSE